MTDQPQAAMTLEQVADEIVMDFAQLWASQSKYMQVQDVKKMVLDHLRRLAAPCRPVKVYVLNIAYDHACKEARAGVQRSSPRLLGRKQAIVLANGHSRI